MIIHPGQYSTRTVHKYMRELECYDLGAFDGVKLEVKLFQNNA